MLRSLFAHKRVNKKKINESLMLFSANTCVQILFNIHERFKTLKLSKQPYSEPTPWVSGNEFSVEVGD